LLFAGSLGRRPEPEKPDKPDGRPKPESRPDDLTPEERKRIDGILSQAWTDPAVIAAREEVHTATDNYRKALRNAVERIDPTAVPLMGKLHDKSRFEAMRRKIPGDRPPGMGPGTGPGIGTGIAPDPAGAIPAIAIQEANLRHLEGPDRERFLQLARQIQEDGTLKPNVKATFETWTRGGRDAGKSRRELRDRFLAEMRKRDPWAAEILKKDPLAESKSKDGGPLPSPKGRSSHSSPALTRGLRRRAQGPKLPFATLGEEVETIVQAFHREQLVALLQTAQEVICNHVRDHLGR